MEDIYSRNYSAGSSYELDNVIQTLEKMGVVRRKTKVIGGQAFTYLVSHGGTRQMPWMIGAKQPKKIEGEPGQDDHLKDSGELDGK